jgi:hypothetical protein
MAPDRQGGIHFEWEKGAYAVEIGISPTGSCELLKSTGTHDEEGYAGFARIRDTLAWLAQL